LELPSQLPRREIQANLICVLILRGTMCAERFSSGTRRTGC